MILSVYLNNHSGSSEEMRQEKNRSGGIETGWYILGVEMTVFVGELNVRTANRKPLYLIFLK